MKVDVRKQGEVWTIFLDERGAPMEIATFDQPPLGFPFTGKGEIMSRFAGATFRFVEKAYDPQPESIFTPAMEKELSQKLKVAPKASPVPVAAPPAPSGIIYEPTAYLTQIQKTFSHYLRNMPKEETENAATFLITAFPALEQVLGELVLEYQRELLPKETKRFKL